jgi:RimJ/RimL family protein N-acetyltransferase
VLNQWSAGHQCHIALHQDRIVSSLWIAFRAAEVPHLGCTLSVGIDGAYAFDAFTSPDYRGRNIAPALSLQARTQIFNSQTRRIITAILPENRSGLRAQLKAGFVPIGVARVLRFPPFRYPFGHAEGCSIQTGSTALRANASR